MRARSFVVPVVGMAALVATALPAHAQTVARSQTAVAAATTLAPGALPGDGDPEWSRTFTELFQDPSLPQWRNLGSRSLPECMTVSDGKAVLGAFPNGDGKAWECRPTSTASFASGTYIFAARVKVHSDQGHLSSFWLNTDPSVDRTNEIDVIENTGLKDGTCRAVDGVRVNRTNYNGLNQSYYDAYAPRSGYKYCFSAAESAPLQDNGFHTFHVEYTPGQSIKYYADGVPTATLAAPYDTPLNVILTNIHQQQAGFPNPGPLEVQWVKVWKKNPPPPVPVGPCEINDGWRAQLGASAYGYVPNSDTSQANQKRYVFDRVYYYSTYADVRAWAQDKVATQGGSVWDHVQWHWLHYGIPQGRIGAPTFDPAYYLEMNPDVANAVGPTNYQGAIEHYVGNGRNEGRSGSRMFDPAFYRGCYGDLAGMSNAELLEHFSRNGLDEGRQGSAAFAPAWYLAANPDVQAAFGANSYRGAMIHWTTSGRGEGRPGHP